MKKFFDKIDDISENLRIDKAELDDDLDMNLDELQELVDSGEFGPNKSAQIQDIIDHLRTCSLLERHQYIKKLEKLL